MSATIKLLDGTTYYYNKLTDIHGESLDWFGNGNVVEETESFIMDLIDKQFICFKTPNDKIKIIPTSSISEITINRAPYES